MNPQVVLGLLGSGITLVLLFELLRRRRLREKYAVMWVLLALAAIVFGLFPGVLSWSADLVGVEVPANLLFFLGSMALLLMTLQHSQELSRLEERTRTLAEQIALLRLELEAPRHGESNEREP